VKYKALIAVLLVAFLAAGLMAAETVTRQAGGSIGDAEWSRGTIVWESGDTATDPEVVTAQQLGISMIGGLLLTPYGETDYFGHPEALSVPDDSISITIHCAAADSTMSDTESTYTGDVKFIYFAISK